MSAEDISAERQFETLVVLRHGKFGGNVQAEFTGEEALAVVEAGRRRDDYDDWPLLAEGRAQARHARERFDAVALAGAATSIDACLCSPPRRTTETAEIFLDDMLLPAGFELAEGLRERDRDIFAYMPDEWARNHPLYPCGGPVMTRCFADGETWLDVLVRAQPELRRAEELAPGGTVLFVTHAEVMLPLRAEPTLGGMTEEQTQLPLMPDPPENVRALQKSAWVNPAQLDFYTRRNPFTGVLESEIAYFRTVGADFDSGWVENWKTRGA